MGDHHLRVLIAPDSFKGTLTPLEAARAMALGVQRACPACVVTLAPVSDGGDGFLEVFAAGRPFEFHVIPSVDPSERPMNARVGVDRARGLVLIESASVLGFPFLPGGEDVLRRNTRGLGILIAQCARRFPDLRIHVSLGGTITMDGGVGAISELGLLPLDGAGHGVPAMPAVMERTHRFGGKVQEKVTGVLLTDVDNLLLGSRGAAAVYGPQKGANEAAVAILENGYAALARALERTTGRPFADQPGFGAAGGIAATFATLLGWEVRSGTSFLFEQLGFGHLVANHDVVLTGEGRFDTQSLEGKATGRVVGMALGAGRRLGLFCGGATASLPGGDLVILPPCPAGTTPKRSAAHTLSESVTRYFLDHFC